ncbi:Pkinase domain-containing protein [Cephalotus follicularis]|uniref:Pkinase domain-containing protein n=1 Tax=Cephalotus follicularis TaxID=3775 RepID=A0A1Q3BHN0_CEPFO|nr:Pkinase domain-containing protein [Cephalotus follicularis]
MRSPSPKSSLLTALFLVLSSLFINVSKANLSCTSSTSRSPCPPFNSTPSFPFSSSPGCGHPSFQIKCTSPHSIISINNLSYALLRYEPNSYSLLLSPQPTTPRQAHHQNCSSLHFLSIPSRSINLSGSPFRVSDASCSRLSLLKPCSPVNLPNCSHCPWECKLIKNPVQLLHGCGLTHRPLSGQGCQADFLGYLDSFLKFGIQVEFDESQRDLYFSSCKDCKSKNGFCGFNSSDPEKPFICFQSNSSFSPPWTHQVNANRIELLCSIFGVLTCLFLVISLSVAIFRSRRYKTTSQEEDPATIFLHRHCSASLLPPVFTYEELETSTNKFDPKRKIGDGGFGSVFLGQLYDGRIAAIKYLHKHHNSTATGKAQSISNKSFCNEILILSSIDHPNLVKLHGYCSDPRGLLLVYDYVSNGTLAQHLHGPTKSIYCRGSLTWQVRLDIALQTALAIEYLHFSVSPAIVHRDITSSNIFVEKDMGIKLGDFGLSRLLLLPETSSSSSCSSGYVWTGPQGTPGYLDPDYHRSFRLTEKSDVYSFGVVLLELISGLRAVDQSRDKREMALADLVVSKIQMGLLHQVVDPVLGLDDGGGVDAAAELAFRCVAADKDDRPNAKEVVEELKRIRNHTRGHRDVAKE